jgi:membrane protein
MARRMEETTNLRGNGDEQSVGELVQQLSQQTASLVRGEIRLATVELQEKGKKAGIGAGMFGGAGVVALYGVGALIAAAILGIGTFLAGILALTGKKQVEQAGPPVPEQAVESAKRDVDEVKKARARA